MRTGWRPGRLLGPFKWLVRRPQVWWRQWWESRLQPREQVTFTQRNLYILPTPAGWGFAVVIMVMLLASINEQINLGYALTFMVSGAALMTMHITHANVRGLSMRLLPLRSLHAGDVLRMGVVLAHTGTRRGRFGLELKVTRPIAAGIASHDEAKVECEVAPASETTVEMDVPAALRGWLDLPRLTLQSRYPMGLFRAWGYWRPQGRVLVWPALDLFAPPLPDSASEVPDARTVRPVGPSTEMPEGLRAYRRGDPLRWIAWKKSSHALASGTGLVSREPAAGRTPDLWLDWDHSHGLQGLDAEARVSRLTSWVILADQHAGMAYGLKLPGQAIDCGQGSAHLRACLDALALWGLVEPPARKVRR
ncbi:DUF58 domain-containing protein [Aquabacterium sp.]|uniref:DUF58 domain-containing protein n=1 Tax=Aquabacterium sp. TaxID=1872578 RepID=UPI0019B9708E|nr:DUF58 domain-containing protein [Aquabacterium sp.]MBC7700958.1 DUF58 domain-containing protein [Aquabacterium sp.]